MKILVPTDFSECADFALEAAVKIALRTRSDISLFHAASMPEDLKGSRSHSQLENELRESMLVNINEQQNQRIDKYKSQGLNLQAHNVFGNFVRELQAFDRENNFDLIVMGSYGASGKQEWFIGSNTQKIVRKIRKNLLVVKNPVNDVGFEKAMFPSSLTQHDKQAFTEFLSFLRHFDTREMHLLAVNTSGFFNQPGPLMLELLEDFKSMAKGFECKTHFISDYSVEAGIRHFAEDFDIRLIGISNLDRSPIKRIFQGSNVEMLVNHSEVPVLVIDHP